MASHHTGGPSLGLGNIDRITPSPKGYFVANMLGLVTGMGIMTSRTGPSLFTIDMEIVQIVTAVPEVG